MEMVSTVKELTMDLVSVIIPIYGVEQYLDRCVRSVVNQSYAHLEIILVDDGSTDRCPAMCDAWANKDSRIQVIHKPTAVSPLPVMPDWIWRLASSSPSLTATITWNRITSPP